MGVHRLVLGYEPIANDTAFAAKDCIDIGGASVGSAGSTLRSGSNYQVSAIDFGEPSMKRTITDIKNGDGGLLTDSQAGIRTMKFTVQVTPDPALTKKSDLKADLLFRLSEINRFLKASEWYYATYKGTPPGEIDGTDGIGKRCVLTVRPSDITVNTYFDVIGGDAVAVGDWLKAELWEDTRAPQFDVDITIITQPYGYGDRRRLWNVCVNGSFEYDIFSTVGTAWTVSGGNFVMSNTQTNPKVKYGSKSVVYIGPGGAAGTNTMKSNQSCQQPLFASRGNGDKVYASCWVYFEQAPTTSALTTIKLIMQKSDNTGPVTKATLLSVNNSTPPTGFASWASAIGKWIQVSALYAISQAEVTAGVNYPALWFEAPNNEPASYKVWYDGAALWLNPINDELPTEYVSFGGSNAAPLFEVYDLKGEQPVHSTLVFSGGVSDVIGGISAVEKTTDSPMPVFFPMVSSFTNATFDPAGLLPVQFAYYHTTSASIKWTNGVGTTLDTRCRHYKVYALYALSNSRAGFFSKLLLTLPNNIQFNCRTDLAGTMATSAPASAADFKTQFIGDLYAAEPGAAWADSSYFSSSVQTTIEATATGGSGTLSIAALYFIPVDGGTLGARGSSAISNLLFSNEGSIESGGVYSRAEVNSGTPQQAWIESFLRYDNPLVAGQLISYSLKLYPGSYQRGAIITGYNPRAALTEGMDGYMPDTKDTFELRYNPVYNLLRAK